MSIDTYLMPTSKEYSREAAETMARTMVGKPVTHEGKTIGYVLAAEVDKVGNIIATFETFEEKE